MPPGQPHLNPRDHVVSRQIPITIGFGLGGQNRFQEGRACLFLSLQKVERGGNDFGMVAIATSGDCLSGELLQLRRQGYSVHENSIERQRRFRKSARRPLDGKDGV